MSWYYIEPINEYASGHIAIWPFLIVWIIITEIIFWFFLKHGCDFWGNKILSIFISMFISSILYLIASVIITFWEIIPFKNVLLIIGVFIGLLLVNYIIFKVINNGKKSGRNK